MEPITQVKSNRNGEVTLSHCTRDTMQEQKNVSMNLSQINDEISVDVKNKIEVTHRKVDLSCDYGNVAMDPPAYPILLADPFKDVRVNYADLFEDDNENPVPKNKFDILPDYMSHDGIILAHTIQNAATISDGLKYASSEVLLYHQINGSKLWKFCQKSAFIGVPMIVKWNFYAWYSPWIQYTVPIIIDFRLASFLASLLKLDLWATDTGNPKHHIVASNLNFKLSSNPLKRSAVVACCLYLWGAFSSENKIDTQFT